MLKKTVLIVLLMAGPAFARELVCASDKDAEVYYADNGLILVTGELTSSDKARPLAVRIDKEPLGGSEPEVIADPDYEPRNPKYKDHNRFTLGDAWCTYHVLLPKDVAEWGFMNGYIQQICEGGFVSTAEIRCFVGGE